MKTLLPAIYLANRPAMTKEASLFGALGRMTGHGLNAASGLGRGAARMPGALWGAARSIPGRIEGSLQRGMAAGRQSMNEFTANRLATQNKPLNPMQQQAYTAGRVRDQVAGSSPWLTRPVGFNSNGLAALAGTGAVGAGANAWINRQAGPGWRGQIQGEAADRFNMTRDFLRQSPLSFKAASWTSHWRTKQADNPFAMVVRKAMPLARTAGGIGGRGGAGGARAAGGFSEYLPAMRQGPRNVMRQAAPVIDVTEASTPQSWYGKGMDWLKATGPGQWAQKNPALAGGIAGAGLMRGGEYARNTIRENRIANLSPMERLMMAGGLIFNPQGVASRLY